MQFRLTWRLEQPLTLPLSYNHIIQGFLYHILSSAPEYSEFLHDAGYQNDQFQFKLFVFSQLQGKYTIKKPNIIFYDQISFEVRSPIDEMCTFFFLAVMHREEFSLCGQRIFLTSCNAANTKIKQEHLTIQMLSPICLYTTYYDDFNSRKTRYLSPLDEDFQELLNINLNHKLESIYHVAEPVEIRLEPLSFSARDKCVTHFKQTLITAYNGTYALSGEPIILDFLYNTGLGAKNSQGFGMFRVV
jgi:CRISPR-associated endoribonuclease Cas6